MPEVIRGVGCVLAVAGCVGLMPGVVHAQTTRLIMEASVDSAQTWSSEVTPTAGGTVYFRVRAQLEGATALGFGGMTLQPILTHFVSGQDELIPFTIPNGGGVPAEPQTGTGRILPFGTGAQGDGSPSGLLIGHEDPGNVLRFAGSRNVSAMTNVAWGVALAQQPSALAGSNFESSLDVVVFRYAVRFNTSAVERLAWPTVEGGLSGGVVKWFLNAAGTSVVNSADVEQVPARVVPGPGAMSVVVVAGLIAGRRRRGRS